MNRNPRGLLQFGAVLAAVLIVWFVASEVALRAVVDVPRLSLDSVLWGGFTDAESRAQLLTYVGSGAVLALIVFAVSVVAVPFMIDHRGGECRVSHVGGHQGDAREYPGPASLEPLHPGTDRVRFCDAAHWDDPRSAASGACDVARVSGSRRGAFLAEARLLRGSVPRGAWQRQAPDPGPRSRMLSNSHERGQSGWRQWQPRPRGRVLIDKAGSYGKHHDKTPSDHPTIVSVTETCEADPHVSCRRPQKLRPSHV